MIYWVIIGLILLGLGWWLSGRIIKEEKEGEMKTMMNLPIYGKLSFMLIKKDMWFPTDFRGKNNLITKMVLFAFLVLGHYTFFWIFMLLSLFLILWEFEWFKDGH